MKNPPNLLFPLDTFYVRDGLPLPVVREVSAAEMPEPYRSLLVHESDMTPTLEAFHGERILLQVIESRPEGDRLWRLVALLLIDSGKPVEFGAIVINLAYYPAGAREAIVEGHLPLGTIMGMHDVGRRSCPQAYVQAVPDALMSQVLEVSGRGPLYGRRNLMVDPHGNVLADILEILPP